MREIVFIQMGQCGNKVGEKVSKNFQNFINNYSNVLLPLTVLGNNLR